MTTYTKAFFGVAEDEPFNLTAAVDAYEWVIAHPDEAPFVVSKALFDKTSAFMEYYAKDIERITSGYVAKRLTDAKRGLSRSVSKSATDAVAIIDEISKAVGDGTYDEYERRKNAERQLRDARGQFRVMNRTIAGATPKKAWSNRDAKKMGIPTPSLPGDRRAAYQNDYLGVKQALDEVRNLPGVKIVAHYTDGTSSGVMTGDQAYQTTIEDDRLNTGLVRADDYKNGVRVARIEAVADQSGSLGTLGYDALAGLGASNDFVSYARETAAALPDNLASFESTYNRYVDPRTNQQSWNRLEASAKLANQMGGKYLPENAQLALQAAQWAGKYEPQAEKVIGPAARRGAYRYRGVEKQPSPVYQNEINAKRSKYPTAKAARDAIIYGETVEIPRNPKNPAAGVIRRQEESRTIAYLKKQLPDAERYELNRKAGTIPPSQGIIINRNGQVVTEAVGYGEDWYLPFNLKNLSQLKGGEYIRTRAFGGLTTEDIYAGLVGGARAVTVVSHSGVFTMEFDDTFRGSRRYNDKAGRMHARYAQLLDAVKSEDVSLGSIPPERWEELRADAGLTYDEDTQPEQYAKELTRLRIKEQTHPKLAESLKDQIRTEVLNEYVQDNNLAGDWSTYAQANGLSTDPKSGINDMDLSDVSNKRIEAAEAEYRQSMNPLKLNGRGYGKAMEALQDQFPYYIARATFTPSVGGAGYDSGYVKPRFIRPEGALAGFYDKTIEGAGKITADRTNYQNRSVMSAVPDRKITVPSSGEYTPERERVRENAEQAPAGGSAPAKDETKSFARSQKADATVDLIRSLREARVWGAGAPDGYGGQEIGMAGLNDVLRAKPPRGFPAVFNGSLDDIRNEVYSNGPKAAEIAADLRRLKDSGWVDAPDSLWRAWESGGAQRAVDQPDDVLDVLNTLGQRTYKYPGLETGKTVEHYDAQIDKMLGNSLFAGMLGEGITRASTADQVLAAARAHAASLSEAQRVWDAREVGDPLGADVSRVMPKPQIAREARMLAQVTQAFRLREDAAKRLAEQAKAAEPQVEVVNINAGSEEEAKRIEERLKEGANPKDEAPEGADPAIEIAERIKPRLDNIHKMIGMDEVSDEVDSLVSAAIDNKRREAAGLPVADRRMHLVFTGNPGTGKTTIARQLTPIYNELGLIPTDKFTEVHRDKLVGGVLGETAMKTQKVFDDARGGVLFIDEAYALKNGPQDIYGQEAIDTLLTNIEDSKNDTVVILAGYPAQMNQFMTHNPGMSSRFSRTISFRDYKPKELKAIADKMIDDGGFTATKPGIRALVNNAVGQIAANPQNANGRDVENLVGNIVKARQARLRNVVNPNKQQLQELTAADVRKGMAAMGLELPQRKKAA